MDNTLGQFHILQKCLIESLTNEHTRKVVVQDLSRCQNELEEITNHHLFELEIVCRNSCPLIATMARILTFIVRPFVVRKKNNEVIGGIGIVFDSNVEFHAILKDILPRGNGVVKAGTKALFTSEKGIVIASSSDSHTIGSVFSPEANMIQL